MRPALSRRFFLGRSLVAAGLVSSTRQVSAAAATDDDQVALEHRLDEVLATPVLRVDSLDKPVVIASMELLRNGRNFVVRVRTSDGAEGIGVPNAMHLVHTYPIFLNRVAPFFVGKDARQLEPLLWELYRHNDNYKYQGLALWVCVAAAEFAILDLLGKLSGRSIGDLLGGAKRRQIAVYRASGNRGNTPEVEVAYLKQLVTDSGARALKFRLGGRMSKNADSLPGRTEKLIALVRETFGKEMTLYADANSSYDVAEAIKIGRLMEEYEYAFYEEPCRFDHFEDTKAVADQLSSPGAGGEQEFSDYGFRWMIKNRGVDIVQPDLHYHGGFIRSLRVARMAHAAGLLCTPHMSGSGLGFLDAAIFAACLDNPVPFTEFKGDTDIPVSSATSSLKCENGMITLPTGPGFGITIDPTFISKAVPVTSF
jgi:L-alanine-DL-glutamate epimerase-like enolase superfamily enzyme